MDTYAEIARAIKAMTGNNGGTALFTAEVKSVEGETCTVLVGKLEVPDVLLTPADEGASGKLVITPKVGSMVTVADLSGGDLRHLAVVHWGEIEKMSLAVDSIELNSGDNGGLVNINQLKQWMQNVETDMNTLGTLLKSSPIAGNGAPAAIQFTPQTKSVANNIEDDKITH